MLLQKGNKRVRKGEKERGVGAQTGWEERLLKPMDR